MAASCRGLSRVVGVSPGPAVRRVHSGAGGHVKAEYDAVVIGAGKAEEPQLRSVRQPGAKAPGEGVFTEPHCLLCSGHSLARSLGHR